MSRSLRRNRINKDPISTECKVRQLKITSARFCARPSFRLRGNYDRPVTRRKRRGAGSSILTRVPWRTRLISTARLKPLRALHLPPINLVVSEESKRNLILGGASCLDAFSAYRLRTPLPCHALGRTTRTREVRASRSSRTREASLQVSTLAVDRRPTIMLRVRIIDSGRHCISAVLSMSP